MEPVTDKTDQASAQIQTKPNQPSLKPPQSSGGLMSWSFIGLLLTQFTVSLNDNILRWLIVPIGKSLFGTMHGSYEKGAVLALTLGGMVFLVPFILLSGYGGWVADRYSKRSVMIWCKIAEVVIVSLAVLSIYWGCVWLMFVLMFLMGAQSAFYSPAKYSSIPEIVSEENIGRANGLIGLTTMLAIILGTVIGGVLYTLTTLPDENGLRLMSSAPGQYRLWLSAVVLIGVAVSGWLTALMIRKLPQANPTRPFPINPLKQSFADLRFMGTKAALLVVALGSAFYWGLATLAQTNIDKFALPEIVTQQEYVSYLLGILTIGIGLGSLISGFLSRGKLNRRLVPFAAMGIGLCAIALNFTPAGTGSLPSSAFTYTLIVLSLLGFAAGMYDIPLLSFLQEESDPAHRGQVIAGSNFLSFSAMFLGTVAFGVCTASVPIPESWGLQNTCVGFLCNYNYGCGMSARQLWMAAGIVTLVVAGIAFACLYFKAFAGFLVKAFLRLFYRIEFRGAENLPKDGAYVLCSNHASYLDGLLMLLLVPYGRDEATGKKRSPRILFWYEFYQIPVIHELADMYRGIPLAPGKRALRAILEANQALKDGEIVGIFPEGGIERGHLIMPLKPGIHHMLRGLPDVPVVPMYIGGVFGSIFGFREGKFIWKWPERFSWKAIFTGHFRRHIIIQFGKPIPQLEKQDPGALRDAIYALDREYTEDVMMKTGLDTDNFGLDNIPARAAIRQWKTRMKNQVMVGDSTGVELTGMQLLIRTLVLRRLLRKFVLEKDEQNVGVLIPPSVPGVVVNTALTLDRRVCINLNYTLSPEVLNLCIEKVGIKHIITSRKVMSKLNYQPNCEVVYLEDYVSKLTLWDKLISAFQAKFRSIHGLYRMLGLDKIDPEDVMTIIFTSGSTGVPKGVMLTHKNVGGNQMAFTQAIRLTQKESVIGILPFFHSFGYTCPLWTVLAYGYRAYYHFSPLECRPIAKLCSKYKPTILVGTPTFLRLYAKRMEHADLESVNIVVSGAERCAPELMDLYESKFGVRPIQGYGITETAPVVAANVPNSRNPEGFLLSKDESIGLPLSGICIKILNLETGEPCKTNETGMLYVKGINIMKGYYGEPEKTAEVLQDGWYCTGDLVYQDEDNFLFIAGRLSRFAKIGGEMVPHEGVEAQLNQALGNGPEDELKLAVTSVPDEKKGEKIVVLYTELSLTPEEINAKLKEQGCSPLWIPTPDAYWKVDAIPVLGTGKLDLFAINQLAKKLANGGQS